MELVSSWRIVNKTPKLLLNCWSLCQNADSDRTSDFKLSLKTLCVAVAYEFGFLTVTMNEPYYDLPGFPMERRWVYGFSGPKWPCCTVCPWEGVGSLRALLGSSSLPPPKQTVLTLNKPRFVDPLILGTDEFVSQENIQSLLFCFVIPRPLSLIYCLRATLQLQTRNSSSWPNFPPIKITAHNKECTPHILGKLLILVNYRSMYERDWKRCKNVYVPWLKTNLASVSGLQCQDGPLAGRGGRQWNLSFVDDAKEKNRKF